MMNSVDHITGGVAGAKRSACRKPLDIQEHMRGKGKEDEPKPTRPVKDGLGVIFNIQ